MIRTQGLAVQFVDFVLSGNLNPRALRLDDTRMLQCLLISAGLGCPRVLHDPERTGCEDSFFLELSEFQIYLLQKLTDKVFYVESMTPAKKPFIRREVSREIERERSKLSGGVFPTDQPPAL